MHAGIHGHGEFSWGVCDIESCNYKGMFTDRSWPPGSGLVVNAKKSCNAWNECKRVSMSRKMLVLTWSLIRDDKCKRTDTAKSEESSSRPVELNSRFPSGSKSYNIFNISTSKHYQRTFIYTISTNCTYKWGERGVKAKYASGYSKFPIPEFVCDCNSTCKGISKSRRCAIDK